MAPSLLLCAFQPPWVSFLTSFQPPPPLLSCWTTVQVDLPDFNSAYSFWLPLGFQGRKAAWGGLGVRQVPASALLGSFSQPPPALYTFFFSFSLLSGKGLGPQGR